MKKIAVVILNWNGQHLLEQFIPSVIAFSDTQIVDIIVVDNASTDTSVKLVNEKFPQVKLLRLDRNYGYAGGYNLALKQIKAEYFILLNSDVEVTQGWIDPLVEYLDNNQDIAAAQPKIKSFRDKSLFEYAGASGGYIDKLGYPFCRGRILSTIEKDKGQYDSVTDIFWASGACLFIRSKDFFEVGGFDESFFAHMEEIDLCWRLNLLGKRLVCIPQSIVYHVGGATLETENPHKIFLNFRNNLFMLYKNLPNKSLAKVMRWRFLLDNLAVLQFRLQGKSENAEAIKRARKEFKAAKDSYSKIRKKIQEQSIHSEISTIYTRSILVRYYLHRIKFFSLLLFMKSEPN